MGQEAGSADAPCIAQNGCKMQRWMPIRLCWSLPLESQGNEEKPENTLTSCLAVHPGWHHSLLSRLSLSQRIYWSVTKLEGGCIHFGSCLPKLCL